MTAGDMFTTAELATVQWRKSTRSGSTGGSNCVEVGVVWRKSTRSGSGGGGGGGGSNCVEVGTEGSAGRVLVRDSKDPEGSVLACSPVSWAAFGALLNAGALDHRA